MIWNPIWGLCRNSWTQALYGATKKEWHQFVISDFWGLYRHLQAICTWMILTFSPSNMFECMESLLIQSAKQIARANKRAKRGLIKRKKRMRWIEILLEHRVWIISEEGSQENSESWSFSTCTLHKAVSIHSVQQCSDWSPQYSLCSWSMWFLKD